MKKHLLRIVALILIICAGITVYAIARLFFSKSINSSFTKKQIFEFELTADMEDQEVGPGDSISVSPVINNTATEEMYVFIEITTPEWNGESLYSLTVNDDWTLVESDATHYVYAYGTDELTVLNPGEVTPSLTDEIVMNSITNAEFSAIDDINITINGYGIDTNGVSSNPNEVWLECEALR